MIHSVEAAVCRVIFGNPAAAASLARPDVRATVTPSARSSISMRRARVVLPDECVPPIPR
jgi:hypothetical protein